MIDFTEPRANLDAFVKLRASSQPEDTVIWWSGRIYSMIPGQRGRHLFDFEGYNVSRIVHVEGGYQHLSREVSLYEEPMTGTIIERWQNPFTEKEVSIVHVWNDPVNQEYLLNGPRGPFGIPFTDLDGDQMCWYLEIPLIYPSALPRQQYPKYSQSDLYQGIEMFQFYGARTSLEDPQQSSVPCHISWTRVGPWLPWMELGDYPGNLVYQCRGYKLPDGYTDLSGPVRAYVEDKHPEYQRSPETFTRPNETSWTYFKKLLDSGQIG